MGSIPVPSTKRKGCPEVARLMTSFFCFSRFLFFHARAPYSSALLLILVTPESTVCPQKGRVSRTSTSKIQLVRKKAGFHGQAHQDHNLSAKRQGFTDKHIKNTLVRKKAGVHGQAHQNHTFRKKAGFHGQAHQKYKLSVKRRGFTDE